jgi:predicted double-glycine peptidase
MSSLKFRRTLLPLCGVCAAASVLAAGWLSHHSQASAHTGMVYSAQGWGGWVPASRVRQAESKPDPLHLLRQDYRAGRYRQVEQEAEPFVKAAMEARRQGVALVAAQPSGPTLIADQARREPATVMPASTGYTCVRQGAEAELISAYAAARRQEFKLAEERFVQANELASYLPDHGAAPFHFGEPEPSLQEEAAYQEVVCVSAQGHKELAESGYEQFMRDYPQSILIHGALKRIARFHGGDVPKHSEAIWKQAMALQVQARKQQMRAQAMCAPECLAHLLSQRGQKADVERLAREMQTDESGTSLSALAKSAAHHGYRPHGLRLTQRGLAEQPLPAVALIHGGHFVVVEHLSPESVTVWDPGANGVGQPATQQIPMGQWQQAWAGYTLTLQ